jgi:hypothetical protein
MASARHVDFQSHGREPFEGLENPFWHMKGRRQPTNGHSGVTQWQALPPLGSTLAKPICLRFLTLVNNKK